MRYRIAAIVFAFFVAGCIQPTPKPVTPDDPAPVVLEIGEASEAYGRELNKRLAAAAAECRVLATAGKFEDLTAANDAWVARSKQIHRDVYGGLIVRAQNNELTDERGKPGEAAAPMFDKMAAGFSRGSK